MLLHLPTVHMAPDIYQLSDANISHSDYSTSRVLRPIGRLQMKHALGYLVRPTIQVMTGLLKREGSLQMIRTIFKHCSASTGIQLWTVGHRRVNVD